MKSGIIQWCLLMSLFTLALGGTFIHDVFGNLKHKTSDQLGIYEESSYGFGLKQSPYGLEGFGRFHGKTQKKPSKVFGDGYGSKKVEKSSKSTGKKIVKKDGVDEKLDDGYGYGYSDYGKGYDGYGKGYGDGYGKGYGDGYGDDYGKGYGKGYDSYGKNQGLGHGILHISYHKPIAKFIHLKSKHGFH